MQAQVIKTLRNDFQPLNWLQVVKQYDEPDDGSSSSADPGGSSRSPGDDPDDMTPTPSQHRSEVCHPEPQGPWTGLLYFRDNPAVHAQLFCTDIEIDGQLTEISNILAMPRQELKPTASM